MASTMEFHLVTPEREVWSGSATMVSARGIEGDVGIMAHHAPLLIRMTVSVVRWQTEDEGELRAVVDGGFLHVASEGDVSRVDVLAEHAELESEIDIEEARRKAEEWERRVREVGTEEAKLELAKALTRIGTRA